MSEGLRMVHLRTVPDAWHAKVLAARLGSEGIVTQLQGNHAGPYPFGAVAVLVEEEQAELAAELLLADEVEAAFAGTAQNAPPFDHMLADSHGAPADEGDDPLGQLGPQSLSGLSLMTYAGTDLDLGRRRAKTWSPWQRAIAAAAALLVAGGPVLAHFLY
jgi:Putative prokaryotic signal transducing protein